MPLMKLKKHITIALLITVSLSLSGCSACSSSKSVISSAFDGTELIPDELNRICIVKIENRSGRNELPGLLKSEIKNRMNSERRLLFTGDIASCDIKLWITLLPLVSAPYSFNPAGVTEKRRLKVTALVTLAHAGTGKTIIKNRETYAEFIYTETGTGSISEHRGITGLTEKLAERIISVITTGWFRDSYQKTPRER
ncbi:MAG TPA: hypothetical protein PK358_06940 [Spirochaetota bacterium]|nr:hypothetical protein [Spirochaetota bacterium]HPJ34554.1 hypothetical protein [Spirochaetota bacterium]